MKTLTCIGTFAAVVVASLGSARPAKASPLILNGGFESGFSSWVRADQLGSDGTFFLQNGTTSPVNGDAVPAPSRGVAAAMTDAGGPGSHVLYQDFAVSGTGSFFLSLDLFLGNRAGSFVTANPATVGLDFSTPALNQQARIDILKSTANPFSVAAADVLLNLYQTKPGDPLVSGYNTLNFDVSALLAANVGTTLRLRIAEVDNLAQFQVGVDNLSLEAVPEPASLALLGLGLAAMYARRRRS
jgi:hypothetical protein